jgi:BlaI family transcriptional regulator, penicillinase repressor
MREDLTRRERQILDVLYRLEEASASEIVEAMPDELANATVRTQLRFLEEKGAVTYRREGKKFLYRAIKPKKNAAKTALRSVLNVFFGGSIEDAVATHLADPKSKLSSDQLERLRTLIDEHSKAKEDR